MATPNLQTDLWLIEEKIAEFYQCKATLEQSLNEIARLAQHGLKLIEKHPEALERVPRRTPIRGVEYRRHLKKMLEAYSLSEICKRMCLTEQEIMMRCLED